MSETFHETHLLKLLDKIYKYEMDPTRTVGSTERTRDAGRRDGRKDGQTGRRTEWTNILPRTSLRGGYNKGMSKYPTAYALSAFEKWIHYMEILAMLISYQNPFCEDHILTHFTSEMYF